jgi:ketosteroid isomerase-like protein
MEAMSQENVELVRSIYEPWGRGDFRSVEWADPDIEFVLADLGPDSGSWRGLSAMADAWRAYLGAWEEYRTEVDEYRELDGERVLVLLHLSGRGKTSGVQLEEIRTTAVNLFHVRGGKVTRLVLYTDRERGLAELGLSEQASRTPLRDTCAGDVAGERGDIPPVHGSTQPQ